MNRPGQPERSATLGQRRAAPREKLGSPGSRHDRKLPRSLRATARFRGNGAMCAVARSILLIISLDYLAVSDLAVTPGYTG